MAKHDMKKMVTKNKLVNKGMSPVVATILLIVLVVILAAIIFLWLRRAFVPEIIEKDGKDIASIVCSEVEFRAVYNNPYLEISNDGNVPIQNMKIKIVKSGSHTESDLLTITKDKPASEKWPELGLGKSRVFRGTLGVTTNGADEIIVTPILRGTSNSGYQDKVCDEGQYGNPLNVV